MTSIVETFTHQGRTVEIRYEDTPSSPREWSTIGEMVCWHRRSDLGDRSIGDEYDSIDHIKQALAAEHDAVAILPVYLYEHSGMTVSHTPFSCPWDSGQVGLITATRDGIAQCIGDPDTVTREQIEQALIAEIAVYDQYLTGDVYTVCLLDDDGDIVESLGDVYGLDDARRQGREIADAALTAA